MADQFLATDDEAAAHESRMVRAIVHDTAIALPAALILVTVALVVFTPKGIVDSASTALLPGVLIGIFFGGFSGTARTMD